MIGTAPNPLMPPFELQGHTTELDDPRLDLDHVFDSGKDVVDYGGPVREIVKILDEKLESVIPNVGVNEDASRLIIVLEDLLICEDVKGADDIDGSVGVATVEEIDDGGDAVESDKVLIKLRVTIEDCSISS